MDNTISAISYYNVNENSNYRRLRFVGSQSLKDALKRGHKVTAIVFNIKNILLQYVNLVVKKVDIFNEDKISSFLVNHDIVLSVYKSGWQNPNIYNDFIRGSKSN